MSRIPEKFGFYCIMTDTKVGYEKLAEICVDMRIPFIQLRMKHADRSEMIRTGKAIRKITKESQTLFIVNDDVNVAEEVEADGLHVGQSDCPVDEARKQLGEGVLIGLSTHNVDQVQAAERIRPDYIGIGPVYKTPTKECPDPVIGIDGMKAMTAKTNLPCVVIGGINQDNLNEVTAAGAINLSAVRWVNQSDHPEDVLSYLRDHVGWMTYMRTFITTEVTC